MSVRVPVAELCIVSAGFDAAVGDDLGECLVTPTGYAHMTYMLGGLAGGRLVVALEVRPLSFLIHISLIGSFWTRGVTTSIQLRTPHWLLPKLSLVELLEK